MAICTFEGPHRFLSNFWMSPVVYDGQTYPSVEHAYQAAKTHNPEAQKLFQLGGEVAHSPGQAKKMGRILVLRPDWEQVKLGVMRELILRKFLDLELSQKLKATGSHVLVEGNWWHDQFWGDCRCDKHVNTPGENHLGKILMDIRASL